MTTPSISKIISGGQTGVDRAALDVAIFLKIPHGGWCPRGRRSEDGQIPMTYQLTETSSPQYTQRTRKNVLDSDGTLILYRHSLGRGTGLTVSLAKRLHRPFLMVDLGKSKGRQCASDAQKQAVFEQCEDELQDVTAATTWQVRTVLQIHRWIVQEQIEILNVAGPRESSAPGIAEEVHSLLLSVLAEVGIEG